MNEELGGEKHDPKKSPNFLDALASCLSFRVVTCNNPLKQQSLFLFCYGLQKLEQTDVEKKYKFRQTSHDIKRCFKRDILFQGDIFGPK